VVQTRRRRPSVRQHAPDLLACPNTLGKVGNCGFGSLSVSGAGGLPGTTAWPLNGDSAFNKDDNFTENVCRCEQRADNGGEDFNRYRPSRSLSQRLNLRTANENSDPDQKLEKTAPSCHLG
jgi:hypothetical protein